MVRNTEVFTKRRPSSPDAPPPESAALAGAAALARSDCGDFDIRIARDGAWYYRGTVIARPALVRLFASVLKRDAAGDYWLETPAERGRIRVDDAPFVAVAVAADGAGRAQRLTFRTNLDAEVVAGPRHALVVRAGADGAPRPYLQLDGGLEALLARPVYYALAELAVPGPDAEGPLGVWSDGAFFPLEPAGATETET